MASILSAYFAAASGLTGVRLRELPAEPLHATGRIDQLLLTGKERVAGRADFQVDVALVRRLVSKCEPHAHFTVIVPYFG